MKPPERKPARGEVAVPAEIGRQSNPLDYIAEEHLRQREICAALDRLAVLDPPDVDLAIEVLVHLNTWLPPHIRDEEEDLFPLLRRRAPPGDDINETLNRLGREHVSTTGKMQKLRAILQRMITSNTAPKPRDATILSEFAAHERRHLIVENAIVLPMARACLTRDDLASLRLRMVQRRSDPGTNGQEGNS